MWGQLAGSKGFQVATKLAKPFILEPIMAMEIVVPEEYMGDIMGDISGRRGRVQGSESYGKNVVIKAQAPMAEVLKYSPDLQSMTQGRGSFTIRFSHYDAVPANIQQKIIDASSFKEEEAFRNPTSEFCSNT